MSIGPVSLNGSECCPAVKDDNRRLVIMETKVMHRVSVVTCYGHVLNRYIKDRYVVASNVEKLREGYL